MADITYAQGETHILQKYFTGGADFGPFYIGLGSNAAIINEYATLSDVVAREVTGSGYARKAVARSGPPTGWTVTGDIAQSPALVFTSTESSALWAPIDFVFLTLSATGTSGDNTIIAAGELEDTIMLGPNQSVEIIFRFRQTTVLSNGSRIEQGEAETSMSVTGEATGTLI